MYYREPHRWKFIIFCSIVFLIFTIPNIGKPYAIDEPGAMVSAKGILEYGIPLYYAGEDTGMVLDIVHPTLYYHILAGFYYVFGISETVTRLPSFLTTILTAIMIYLISIELMNKRGAAIAVSIYLLHPYVIQSSLMANSFDGGCLIIFLMLFIYCILKYLQKRTILNYMIGSFALTLALWSKLPATLMILASLIFLWYRYRTRIDSEILLILGFGIFYFILTWLLYTSYYQINPMIIISNILNHGAAGMNIWVHLWDIKNAVFWISPVMIVLFGWAVYQYLKRGAHHFIMHLMILSSIIIIIAYTLTKSGAYDFPKYYAPLIPMMAIIIGHQVGQIIDEITFKQLTYVGILSMIPFISIGDPLLSDRIIYLGASMPHIILVIFVVSIMLLLLLILIFSCKKSRIISSLFVCMLITSISYDIIQANADYSTSYLYGEKGYADTVHALKDMGVLSTIIAPKDIAFVTGHRFYSDEGMNIETLKNIISTQNIRLIILRDAGIFSDHGKNEWLVLNTDYTLLEKIGDFSIYTIKYKSS